MVDRFLRHPLPYLVLLLGLAYWSVEANGWLEPEITNDTQSYEHLLEATTVAEALSGLRTYGYPLVIRLFGLEGDGWVAVPRFHFSVYALAIIFFWAAVTRFARSRWAGFAAAAPLCLASALAHVRLVVTDSIAESLGLVAVSLLLMLAAGSRRLPTALALGLTVFLVVWIRPIYQFLVVLVPLAGAVLRVCYAPRQPLALRRWTISLAALTFVPFFGIAVVRWATVGELAVSSFTGYHIGSIGALMLDEELVAEMPEESRRLAREIFEERRRRGLRPMRLASWRGKYQDREFGLTMFDIAEPIATRIVLEDEGRTLRADRSTDLGPLDIPGMMGPTALEIDRRLGALGRAAIRARPLVYVRWVVEAVRMGFGKALGERLVPLLLVLLTLSLPLALAHGARDPAAWTRPGADRALGLVGLALVGGLYFLGHTAVVALVHWPKDRYATAANLLLPTVLAVGLFELWRWMLPARPPAKAPSRAARLARLGAAAVLCVLVAETLFRVTGFDFDRQAKRLEEVPIFRRWPTVPTGTVFFRRPGPAVWKGPVSRAGGQLVVRYDDAGFRNPQNLADWQIVVVGDDLVESGHLADEELFTSELARQTGLEVKNLGVGFTGTLTHIHYLETWGKSASTRHAILAFNEGDDLDDLEREASELWRFEQRRRRPYRWTKPQSSLVTAIYHGIARLAGAEQPPSPLFVEATANADLLLPGRGEPLRVHVSQRPPGRQYLSAERLERLDEVIGRWGEAARRLGLEPWVLYMPSKHRILHPYLRYDADVPEAVRSWRPTDLPDVVSESVTAHGIGFLNPGPRLANAVGAGTMVYDPSDPTLDETGSRFLGRLLAARLTARERATDEAPPAVPADL